MMALNFQNFVTGFGMKIFPNNHNFLFDLFLKGGAKRCTKSSGSREQKTEVKPQE